MSAEIIIAEWRKNTREILRVRFDNYKGNAVICIRVWYADKDGILKPGRGGLTVSVRHLPALASALAKALEMANAAGFLTVLEP